MADEEESALTTTAPVRILAKIERRTLSAGQKLANVGIAMAWGALGESVGQILGFFVQVSPNGLGHACGTILASLCTIYLARGKPVTLKECLRALVTLREQKLINHVEYAERRQRCLKSHDF
jgi:hypothetical protein